MNETWQGMAQALIASTSMPKMHSIYTFLAQVESAPTTRPARGGDVLRTVGSDLSASLPDLLRAIVILVVGWLIALIAAAIVRGILKQTDLDNRLARSVVGGQPGAEAPAIEKWISSAVFWLIFIFTIVAFLQALQLTAVSEPLNNFLNQIIGYLPAIAGAAILLGVAWLLATLVKLIVTRTLKAFNIDERLGQQVESPSTTPPTDAVRDPTVPGGYSTTSAVDPRTGTATPPPPSSRNQFSLSDTIGNTLYWFIFLLFLPLILNTLGLQGTLAPVQELLNEILGILPNVFAAILIAAAGWLVAQVVRRIVTNFLAATGTDRIGTRLGLNRTSGSQSLSWILGTVVYVLILIPTAIAALNALQIEAISGPAIAMLEQILTVLPQIFTAGLILALAYVIGQFLSDLVTGVLTGVGFNNVFYWLGLQSTPSAPTSATVPPPAQPEALQGRVPPATVPTKTPSEVAGIIVLVGVMLIAALAAIDVLNIPALTALVGGIVLIAGRILAGLVVFAIGLYLANLAFNLITSSGGRQAKILGQVARIAGIAFSAAIALQLIGVANDIVNLAFGLLLGAIAVAIALAFGLGGRDVAAEQLREWLASFKQNRL
ncbi:mechanosensitive ion channel [Leptolyngbya sp. FACHB-541]|uniref:mechanosensitive ion channel n=1 Tax=Leptolyngbya sp. FACHB-541 TaxID=2692810 RepID=UPI001684AD53|nr:mechanosensitive ion channel [Leptolyngbya sp. FACHB-541]MBD1997259.1 mechanosensitive ion channel [Leptolyngbya sp. FACHB-541]